MFTKSQKEQLLLVLLYDFGTLYTFNHRSLSMWVVMVDVCGGGGGGGGEWEEVWRLFLIP